MGINVKSKQFRDLAWMPLMVSKVYNFYNSGYVDSERRFRTFVYFPSRLTDTVIISWDERAKPIEGGERMELREKFWDNDIRKFCFKKVSERLDLKLFKKVVDIEFVSSQWFDRLAWDKELKKEMPIPTFPWEKFVVEWLSASKVKTMLDDLDLSDDVPLIDGKDKLGNSAKVRQFGWEDKIKWRLEGKFLTFKVQWTWIDTRYRFKEAPAFSIESDIEKDFPSEKKDWGITIEDVAF